MDPRYKLILDDFDWTRRQTIELFKMAQKHNCLDYLPNYKGDKFKDRNIFFQFQCVITTTDTVIRRLTNHSDQSFGKLFIGEKMIPKRDITPELIEKLLPEQPKKVREIVSNLKDFNPKIGILLQGSLVDHEFLHQGQLIVMFREVGCPFSNEFARAWSLNK